MINSKCQTVSGLSECTCYEASAGMLTDSGCMLEMSSCFDTVKWKSKLSKANRSPVATMGEHKCKTVPVNLFLLLFQRLYTPSPWDRYIQHVLPHARHAVAYLLCFQEKKMR